MGVGGEGESIGQPPHNYSQLNYLTRKWKWMTSNYSRFNWRDYFILMSRFQFSLLSLLSHLHGLME